MIEFRTLGMLDLRVDGRELTPILAQPKRLALLAYLSIATPRAFHRRDTLLGLFWPESDQEHARTSLRKALHVLRHTLGERTIQSRGDEDIGVDPEALWCDAVRFDQDLDAGMRERDALALYKGDLLCGLHVSMSAGFESWLESERARVRKRAHQAACVLARQEDANRNPAVAAEWLRRALVLDPDNEPDVRHLMQLLDGMGDRAGALREYERLANRLHLELEVDPSPETQASMAAIKSRSPPESIVQQSQASSEMSEASAPGQEETSPQPDLWGLRPAHRSRQRGSGVALGMSILLGAGLLLTQADRQGLGSSTETAGPTRLAVLPFTAGDTAARLFADGMQEEISARLGRVPGLSLIARSSALRYPTSHQTAPEFGRAVRVDYVLDGTVRSVADAEGKKRLRITSELIRVADGVQVWGAPYEVGLADVFDLQADVAVQVAGALRRTLRTREGQPVRTRPTENLEAYRLYVLGRSEWNHRTAESLDRSADYFRQALRLDSSFARAWAGLADAYALYDFYAVRTLPRDSAYALAKAAALRAVALDPSLAEPHASLNQILRYGYWDWNGSEREVRRAIALDPNYATAHQWLAEHLLNTRRSDEALLEATIAEKLDPLSAPVKNVLGTVLWDQGRHDEAIAMFRAAIAQDPTGKRARLNLYSMYIWQGRAEEALAVLAEAHDTSMLAQAVARARHDPRARAFAMRELASGPPRLFGSEGHFLAAELYGSLGEPEAALLELERALAERSPELEGIKSDPFLTSLHHHPRFAAVARKIGLTP